MKHKISISFQAGSLSRILLEQYLKKCIVTALRVEKVPVSCEINVLVTDNLGIRALNSAHRQIDKETDVLSFPMFSFQPGELPEDLEELADPESGLLALGDIAISLEKVKAQAKEFGHSEKRELGYLAVHSVLHLLGYDHVDEGPMKRQMRAREETIMAEILLPYKGERQ